MKKTMFAIFTICACLVIWGAGAVSLADDGLVGYWSFNEGSGDTAYDYSGNENDGTIHGASWTMGVSGNALDFDGVDDYVDCGNFQSLVGSNELTMSLWFYTRILPDVLHDNDGLFIQHDDYNHQYGIRFNGSNQKLAGYVESEGIASVVVIPYSGNLNTFTWYHLVYTFSNGYSKIYLNGTLKDTCSQPAVTSIPDLNSNMLIGSLKYYQHFDGVIDEVRIYDRALSEEEIQNLYEGLVGYWSFDEGIGDTAYDYSGNGNNGTIYDASWTSGISGTALEFDGLDDYIELTQMETLCRYGATLTWWMKAANTTSTGLFAGQLTGASINHLQSRTNSIQGEANKNCNYIWFNDVQKTTEWAFYGVVLDDSRAYLYVNGGFWGESYNYGNNGCAGPPVDSLVADLLLQYMGVDTRYNPQYAGIIDEVRIYNRALSAAEVEWLYYNASGQAGPVGAIAGTVTDTTGTPIGGANVTLLDYESYSCKTDVMGNYEIADVPVGTYDMDFQADGYSEGTAQSVEVNEEQTTPQNFQLPFLWPIFMAWTRHLDDVDDLVSPGDHADLTLRFFNLGTWVSDVEITLTGEPSSQGRSGILFQDPNTQEWGYSVILNIETVRHGLNFITTPIYVERVDYDDLPSGSVLPRVPRFEMTCLHSWPNTRSFHIHRWEVDFDALSYSFPFGSTMLEKDCIRHPDDLSIRKYAQFAVGNPWADSTHLDPDTRRNALGRVLDQVHCDTTDTVGDFSYDEDLDEWDYLLRNSDMDLLQQRGGEIGNCMDYMDLSTGLHRSLGLQTRDMVGWIFYWENDTTLTLGGHAWNEILVNGNGNQDSWMHYDATAEQLDNKSLYAWVSGVDPLFVYGDLVPLSNLGRTVFHHIETLTGSTGVSDCNPNFAEYDCDLCEDKSPLENFQPDYFCGEDVTAEYGLWKTSQQSSRTLASTRADTAMSLIIDAPISVEKDVGFNLVGIVSNSGESCKYAIEVSVTLRPWAFDSLSTYSADTAQVWIDSLPPGASDTVNWIVTPLRLGKAVPLSIYSTDSLGTFYANAYMLQNINATGTLPDLAMTAAASPSIISPGETVNLTATVFNDSLQKVTDATVSAHVLSKTNPGFEDTVLLAYSESDSAYVGDVTIEASAPLGVYSSTFSADKTGFDPDTTTTHFSVASLVSLNAQTDTSVYAFNDTVLLSATVEDRGDTVGEALVNVLVHTPQGDRTLSMESDSLDQYHLFFAPADFVPHLGDTTLEGGLWNIIVSTDYYDSYAQDSLDITVQVPDLSISSDDISLYPHQLTEGDNVLISAVIRNVGTAVSETTEVRFYLDQIDSISQIGADYEVAALAVDGSVAKSVMWNTTGKGGEHTIYVLIDPVQLAVESDRSNNSSSTLLSVAFSPAPEPVEGLRATLAGDKLVLEWTPVTVDTLGDPVEVDLYRIYRDTVPGFEVVTPFDSTADTFYVDSTGVVGDTGVHYYYAVTAVAGSKESASSGQVGEFDQYLISGSEPKKRGEYQRRTPRPIDERKRRSDSRGRMFR